ncbi:RelA/SpoT family protein [Marinicella gelatinilytica]|uniref:RelA/SpoT family protein n=1 Tax=Marinicella gelatinilytica TaxID=2996017 RepID=UPI002260D18F|nr:bifunctional (p)ppGpp synthetase/guanosine-3',5'-bis(diphosphate) 3'-pyrophosphohydrolase [Marinicella gelatinilytica]MCX7544423.1 bifunctional (p)ppGpp synthetase/guanosine-3',5'-bis(diphosphate) 3'-pyrophosphohydrolase [Marinicella gelatinilytica]
MNEHATQASEDFWLDDNHCSKDHKSKTLHLLDALKADQDIKEIFVCFHQIRNYPDSRTEVITDLTDAQRETLDDLLKIHQADWLRNPKSSNAEGLRRLLFAMLNDVRLVLILLAEQLVLMRAALNFSDDIQKQLATSTMTYHAALANRLGVWQIKWELEDLSFRFLDTKTYRMIAKKLAEKRDDREQFISRCSTELQQVLKDNNIAADIAGRPKHIYSIFKKMQQKNLQFEGLYDIRAIRVLVDTVADCYAALGLVHAMWPHVPKEFDDYIAQPKGNMYQSLHTVVMVSGKTLEVQIRTHQMHEHAELGVAAHWRYKDGSREDSGFDKKVNWMRELLNENTHSDDLLGAFQSDTQEERVYVFTPQGDVIDLPQGSTAVDFAYQVHTEVGHRCQGAKINGAIIPLTRPLKTGEQIEILTAKEPKPSKDWLYEQSGYLQSARARAKVRQWFRENNFDKNLTVGKDMLERELNKYALQHADINNLLSSFNLQSLDKLYTMIATGDITVSQVLRRADQQLNPKKKPQKAASKSISKKASPNDLVVEGVADLKTTFASCCKPMPGDSVGGFITRTRGISVHRRGCDNFIHMISEEPNRLINVRWRDSATDHSTSVLNIIVEDRKNVIKDMSHLLAQLDSDIVALNTDNSTHSDAITIEIAIQTKDFDHLNRVINRLSTLQSVKDIRRKF